MQYAKESHWHKSQKLTAQKDGSLIAEFQLTDTQEIKRWIMSFGRHAIVLEPVDLRNAIAEEARATLLNHSPGAVDRREA